MTLSSRQTRDEESVTYLRAELAHAVDPSRRARLLFEIALAEERNNEEGAAVRDYFAAHHADTDFAEPLEALLSLAEKDPSVEGSDELFAGLIGVASSPDEQVRARVEHVFQVMKLKFGFVKVRYRGLKKNAHRLFVTCALVNLFVSRRKLLAVA